METTINLVDMKPEELEVIKKIFGLVNGQTTKEEYEKVILKLEKEINTLKEQLSQRENAVGKVKLLPLTIKECVLRVIKREELVSVQEIQDLIEAKPESVQGLVSALKSANIICASGTRPKKYFLKSKGNPELRSMFPKGTKASFMK